MCVLGEGWGASRLPIWREWGANSSSFSATDLQVTDVSHGLGSVQGILA